MKTIKGTASDAAKLLADRISTELSAGKKVLWLLPGGSNIQIAAEAMHALRKNLPAESFARLSGILTDERYGEVGHKDSNWKQLHDAGFDFSDINVVPVLSGISLEDTVAAYEQNFNTLCRGADVVIGQFGIGADSHVAGALPESPAIVSAHVAVGYQAPGFTRVTLTIEALKKIDVAYAFVFGASKREALAGLLKPTDSYNEKPAAVLWAIREACLVSDQI